MKIDNGLYLKYQVLNCPKCGHEVCFELLEGVDLAMHPERYEQIDSGKVIICNCDYCGKNILVDHDFLLWDSHKLIAIENRQYLTSLLHIDKERASKLTDEMIGDLERQGYIYRVVTNIMDLRDRIAVFNLGLDDRIMELYKAKRKLAFFVNHPECRGKFVVSFLINCGNEHRMYYYVDMLQHGSERFSIDLYREIEKRFAKNLVPMREEKPFVCEDLVMKELAEREGEEKFAEMRRKT